MKNLSFLVMCQHMCHTFDMSTPMPLSADTLVAMRTLIQAGLSDEAVGRALRELLCPRPLSSATAMYGANTPASAWPTVSASPEPRERPVPDDHPGESEFRPDSDSTTLSSTKAAPVTGNEVLKVRLSNGKPSNVTIPGQLLIDVAAVLGSVNAAREKVRQLAKQVPETAETRSGWIQLQLTQLILSGSA